MDVFRQPVHYYKDGIVPFGLWQLSDSVNGDDLPMAAWDLVGHKLPHLLCWEGFAAVAGCHGMTSLLSFLISVCPPPHLCHLLTPSNLIHLPSAASAPTLRCTHATMLHPHSD